MRPTRAFAALLALLLPAFAPGNVLAQGPGGPVWVPLDRQPPGTPARVVLNQDMSGPAQTVFDVFVSGFFVTTRTGPDGRTYQDMTVPGLPSESAPGEPRLPIVRLDLGVVTTAPAATLTEFDAIDLQTLPGYLVWPSPIPAELHDGAPSQFTRDEATYSSTIDVPAGGGSGAPTRGALGGIPASLCTAYPVHWNPATGVLSVAAHGRFTFAHGGALDTPMGITREHADLASNALFNWGSIETNFTVDFSQYNGMFLIVCPVGWTTYLQKFIQEKKTRGFLVTVITVPQSGETCAQLRQSIQNWYYGTPAGADHYALLVGTGVSTPLCIDQFNQISDKVLSSVDSDHEAEIFMGRLFVSNTAELQIELKKILDYETGPQVNQDGHVLLVAHREQSQDFDFQSEQEEVRTATYAQVTPAFTTCYGTNGSVSNTDIENDINSGVGVVAYTGHGGRRSWLHWCALSDSFGTADAAALTNGALTPVVWSIACYTADLRDGQNLAHGFLKNSQGGAVAFYGAMDQTYGSIVHVLNDSLFQAVYGRGITRHGLAIAYGEHATIAADSTFGGDAVYKYTLYGDPDMEIKRHNAGGIFVPIDLLVPIDFVTPCPGSDCCPSCPPPIVDIQARDATGTPVPNVKIGIWKPTLAGTDEVLANRYSGADGWVHIPAPGVTAGTLLVGFDDGDGRAGLDSMQVHSTVTGIGLGPPPPLRLIPRPSVTPGATDFFFGRTLAAPAQVRLFSVDGRLVRSMVARAGTASLRWDGRDRAGHAVSPGVYLARVESGGLRAGARIVVLR